MNERRNTGGGHGQPPNIDPELVALVNEVNALLAERKVWEATMLLQHAQRSGNRYAAGILAKLEEAQGKAAAHLDPGSAEYWNEKGANLLESGRLDEGLDCFERALGLNPELKSALGNIALVLNRQEKFSEALLYWERALALDPASAQLWNMKGMTFASMSKHSEAVLCYDRALQLDASNPTLWYHKSLALTWLGQYEEAIVCADRAMALNPRDIEPLFNKAKALTRLGREAEALKCGEQMLSIDPLGARQLLNLDD